MRQHYEQFDTSDSSHPLVNLIFPHNSIKRTHSKPFWIPQNSEQKKNCPE